MVGAGTVNVENIGNSDILTKPTGRSHTVRAPLLPRLFSLLTDSKSDTNVMRDTREMLVQLHGDGGSSNLRTPTGMSPARPVRDAIVAQHGAFPPPPNLGTGHRGAFFGKPQLNGD